MTPMNFRYLVSINLSKYSSISKKIRRLRIMVDKKESSNDGKSAPKREVGVAEEKIGNMGAKAGTVVDKVVAAPGNLLHSAISTATGAVDKASKAASDVAQGVANRLDPDSDKK
jgi:hypothetical protein